MRAEGHSGKAAVLLIAMGLYLIGSPIACFVFASWWPLAIGLGALLGVVCILMAIVLVQDSRGLPLVSIAELQRLKRERDVEKMPRPRSGDES